MNDCPYCGKPMEKGYMITVGGEGSYWLPDGETLPLLLTQKAVSKKHGIMIKKRDFWKASYKETYVCRDCRKAILDLE